MPRIRITDARVKEVRRLCLALLEDLLITEMEATYGATWSQIIKVLRSFFGPPVSGSIS
jgi:hypothetical protein